MKLEHNFIRIQKKQKSMNNNRAANEISAATKRRKAKRIKKNCTYWVTAKKASKFITLAQQAGVRLKGAVVFGEIL